VIPISIQAVNLANEGLGFASHSKYGSCESMSGHLQAHDWFCKVAAGVLDVQAGEPMQLGYQSGREPSRREPQVLQAFGKPIITVLPSPGGIGCSSNVPDLKNTSFARVSCKEILDAPCGKG
jgi:hypothetical protein